MWQMTDLSFVCVFLARVSPLNPEVCLRFNLKPSNPRASSHQSLSQVKRPIRETLLASCPDRFISNVCFLQGDSSRSGLCRSQYSGLTYWAIVGSSAKVCTSIGFKRQKGKPYPFPYKSSQFKWVYTVKDDTVHSDTKQGSTRIMVLHARPRHRGTKSA